MRVYSSYDLLGKELGITSDYTGTDLFSRFFNWVDRLSSTVVLKIEVPSIVYLKTQDVCETMNKRYKDYNVNYYAQHVVENLYNHFIMKAYNNKHGMKHAYEVLSRYSYNSPLVIVNHMTNEKHSFHHPVKNKMHDIRLQLNKQDARKGELLLYELDELYGHQYNLEHLISSVWIDFIQDRRKSSDKKIINEILDILDELE